MSRRMIVLLLFVTIFIMGCTKDVFALQIIEEKGLLCSEEKDVCELKVIIQEEIGKERSKIYMAYDSIVSMLAVFMAINAYIGIQFFKMKRSSNKLVERYRGLSLLSNKMKKQMRFMQDSYETFKKETFGFTKAESETKLPYEGLYYYSLLKMGRKSYQYKSLIKLVSIQDARILPLLIDLLEEQDLEILTQVMTDGIITFVEKGDVIELGDKSILQEKSMQFLENIQNPVSLRSISIKMLNVIANGCKPFMDKLNDMYMNEKDLPKELKDQIYPILKEKGYLQEEDET